MSPSQEVSGDGWKAPAVHAALFLKRRFDPLIYDGMEFWTFCHGVWAHVDRLVMADEIASDLSKAGGRAYTDAVFEELSVIVDAAPNPWDPNPSTRLVNCGNGIVDAATGLLRPHFSGSYSRVQIAARYDKGAQCPRWMQFLVEAFDGAPRPVTLLQRYFGLCLLPMVHSGKFLLIHGPQDSGKSTAIRALVHVLGLRNVAGVWLKELSEMEKLALLPGKLLNLSFCMGLESDGLSRVAFRRLIAGDSMLAKSPGRFAFQFKNTAKFIIEAERAPEPQDLKGGLGGSMLCVEFKNSLPPYAQDQGLDVQLQSERDGIFCWMLEGARAILERSGNGRPLFHD